MIYYLAEREIIHLLRRLCLVEAIDEAELMSFVETGVLDCDVGPLTDSLEDFITVALMIGDTLTLFETLEGVQTCAPRCMELYLVGTDRIRVRMADYSRKENSRTL